MHQFSTTFHTARLCLLEVGVPAGGRIAPDLTGTWNAASRLPGPNLSSLPLHDRFLLLTAYKFPGLAHPKRSLSSSHGGPPLCNSGTVLAF
jgi:hypothetical protein